jgi:hypothetical protein
MTLFLVGLLLAVALMLWTARKASRENRGVRRGGKGFIGGSPYIGHGDYGSGGSDDRSSGGGDSGGSWGGGDGGGWGGGGGDGGGGGGGGGGSS